MAFSSQVGFGTVMAASSSTQKAAYPLSQADLKPDGLTKYGSTSSIPGAAAIPECLQPIGFDSVNRRGNTSSDPESACAPKRMMRVSQPTRGEPPRAQAHQATGSLTFPISNSNQSSLGQPNDASLQVLPPNRVSRLGSQAMSPPMGGSHSIPLQRSVGSTEPEATTLMGEGAGPTPDKSRMIFTPSQASQQGDRSEADSANQYFLAASSAPTAPPSDVPSVLEKGGDSSASDGAEMPPVLEQTVVPIIGQFLGPPSVDDAASKKQVKFNPPLSGERQLPGLLSLPADDQHPSSSSGPRRSLSPTPDGGDGLSAQYLDMRISKIRGMIDWRVNDLSRVIQQTEDTWAQQLENERRTRQDSVHAVRQLAETQKLILEAGIAHEKSRVDSVATEIATCRSEVRAFAEVAAEMGDEMQNLRMAYNDHMQNSVGVQQLELLENRLQCEIDIHKATLSQAVSKELSRIDGLLIDVDKHSNAALTDVANSDQADADPPPRRGKLPVDQMTKLDSIQIEHARRLEEIEEVLRLLPAREEQFDQHIRGIGAEFSQHRDALESQQQCLQRMEAAAQEDREYLKMLKLKADYLTSPITGTMSISQPVEIDIKIAGLTDRLDKHADVMQSLRTDVNLWETLLSDYVLQGKERADNLDKNIEQLRTQRSRLSDVENKPRQDAQSQNLQDQPSTEVLEATLEGRVVQLVTRLDLEQMERRRMQNSLNDFQTMQHNNCQELNALRSQLQIIPDRVREASRRLDDEVRDRQDALSAMQRDIKGLEITFLSTAAQEKGRVDAMSGELSGLQTILKRLQNAGSRTEELEASLHQRIDSTVSRLKQEEHQRKDAFESVRRDVDRMPSVIWDTTSGERERIAEVGQQLEKMAAQIQVLEAALNERISEIFGLTEIVGILQKRSDQKGTEKDRTDSVLQQLEAVVQPALTAAPQVKLLGERCERMQESIEKLEMDRDSRKDAVALIERSISQARLDLVGADSQGISKYEADRGISQANQKEASTLAKKLISAKNIEAEQVVIAKGDNGSGGSAREDHRL